MFGPNNKTQINQNINFHHREDDFFYIYADLISEFKKTFNITDDFDVLIVNGSGSLAIETVIFSFLGKFKMIGVEGKFKNRWESLLATHNKLDNEKGMNFYCQLETSNSTLQEYENNFFIDCVSSFPYVSPPKDTNIWATVSSKCLGSVPVLGVLIFRKDLLRSFVDKSYYSYLNFLNLVEFRKTNQTPQTPPIPLYMDFLEKLRDFNSQELIEKINYRCDQIVNILGKDNFIGDTRCPVLTFNKSLLHDRMNKYKIYGSSSKGSDIRQIFVYSQDDNDFDEFIIDLKK
jgi:aspartate aminotransferase-like enzyme